MSNLSRWLVLLGLVLGAAVSFFVGFAGGVSGFIVLGAVFELLLFFKLLKKK